MRLTFCLTICLMQICSYASASAGKYTVIAPGTIHSNDKYTAAVSVHHTGQPCIIKVGITGPSYNETKEVEVSQNEVKHVDFDVPTLEKGDYNVTAEGINCMDNFKNSTKLHYAKFTNHVRIQTDKGLYKPGDDINFRAIFLDKDLKPAEPEKNAVIWFEDGKRNRIKEIKDFKTVKGVYTGKFTISEFPVTGGWRLGVQNGGRFDRTVYFEVDKYVLPKYVVKVESTESVSVKDGDMQIIVRANYTYGKPLDGKTTVVLSLGSSYYIDTSRNSGSPNEQKQPPTIIKTADMVHGKAKIDLNVREYEPHLPYKNSPSYLSIVATVEEQFTGVKINGSTSTTLYPYRYSMNCVSYDTCSTFEVGKEKNVLFQITYIDGSTLKDTKTPVELIYKEVLRKNQWWHRSPITHELNDDDTIEVTTMEPPVSENRVLSFKGHMNETGFVNFKVSLPDLPEYESYSHYYSLELKYLDEQRELYTTYQYREPKKIDPPKDEDMKPREYFILMDKFSPFSKLHLNKEDNFTLNSSQPLRYFDYHIVGRGNILKSGHVDLLDKLKVYNLTLTPEFTWAPNFGLYVYYVDEKGEYHYAEQRYHIDFELQNQINITAAEQVKPGEEVALKIKTTPNSFVGLMAVDQSVLLLKQNNDLNPYEFNWVLGSYSTSTPHQGGYSEYPGTTTGCVTLTNADYFYNWTSPDYISRPFSAADRGFISNDDFNLKTAVQSASPGVGVVHESAMSASGGGVPSVQVRKDFSETWLFSNIENTQTEEFTWSNKIPETITSWVVTGFSLNPTKGLGVTKEQTKIKTFLPFFISIRLPYSVKRGEVINVPALVFNYLDKALDVEVTLDNTDDEYEFTEFTNEIISEQKRSKSIRVPANGAAGVSFLLKPKIIGNVMLKFTAISPVAGDAIHKSMKVVPEGITKYANRAYFVNLKNEAQVKSSFTLELPEDLVPDSQHVKVGVMGDILGPVLNNLNNLVRLPTGCGEQTMSSLMPNYLVMKYLKITNRLTPNLETKLRFNMETGYQNMLNYRHIDGSFSSFGPPQAKDKPRNGSTWLTAYVVRSLQQIKEFINVNQNIIDEGISFLSKQQAPNGSFIEHGYFFYSSQKNHITLTGTAILALLKNDTVAANYATQIRKGLDFIADNIDKTNSLHAQAVGTYTLNKAKHAAAKDKLSKLKSLAKSESDRMWWSSDKKEFGHRWWYYVYSDDVEITSYVLLTLLNQESTKVDDVVPIIKWLIAQRNSYGGFVSTQDTVIGLTALIKFAKFAGYEPAKMNVDIESMDKKETIKLTEDNGILYQNVEMPPKTKSIEFTAKGTGAALVQIAYQYNIFEKEPKPSFTIKTTKMDNKNRPSYLEVLVCVNYVGDEKSSNMALLEISTPSGYVIEDESLKPIRELKRVSNIELKNADSLLVVYFDHLYKDEETCLMVEALRTHAVALQKPASIVLYDYYDTSKKATSFYEVDSKLCDICEGEEDCSKCK